MINLGFPFEVLLDVHAVLYYLMYQQRKMLRLLDERGYQSFEGTFVMYCGVLLKYTRVINFQEPRLKSP